VLVRVVWWGEGEGESKQARDRARGQSLVLSSSLSSFSSCSCACIYVGDLRVSWGASRRPRLLLRSQRLPRKGEVSLSWARTHPHPFPRVVCGHQTES